MSKNMERWTRMKQPPAPMLKPIRAGRLSGKSNINPQWRDRILTEEYGPCGFGWKYEIDELWTVDGADGQVFAFARVSLFVKDEDVWSAPITMVGGDMLITKETKGLYHNDEAFKMAITDALGKAAAKLGVAADVYMELWDGAKYLDEPDHDEDKQAGFVDWLAKLDEAEGSHLSNWWRTHGSTVKQQCGEQLASKVYAAYLERKKQPVGAS